MENVLEKVANLINKNDTDRIIIGISGHGASGKTTFARNLANLLKNEVNYINTDPYIITDVRKHTTIEYEYHNQQYSYKMTACHPAAHNLLALERDVKMVRRGLDFYTMDTFCSQESLISSSNSITVVEGMSVAFIDPKLFDLTIFLYVDGETELSRRGIRDVLERGAQLNFLKNSHEHRRIQYDLFMHPYSKSFNIVIKNSNEKTILEKFAF